MPAQNLGIAPPDAGTDVGQLRYLLSDLSYTPVDPPEDGYNASYENWGDIQLQVFVDRAGGDIDKAAAYAYRNLGDFYASQAVNVQTDDLRVDLTKRAQFYYDRADKIDDTIAASVDIFELAEFGSACSCPPELVPGRRCACLLW
jgi:hypothetical protein